MVGTSWYGSRTAWTVGVQDGFVGPACLRCVPRIAAAWQFQGFRVEGTAPCACGLDPPSGDGSRDSACACSSRMDAGPESLSPAHRSSCGAVRDRVEALA